MKEKEVDVWKSEGWKEREREGGKGADSSKAEGKTDYNGCALKKHTD